MDLPPQAVFFLLLVWLAVAAAAAIIAPARYTTGVFFTTLLFMGPFGIGVAWVMTSIADAASAPPVQRPIPEGRRRLGCVWCGAKTDVPHDWDESFDCWQCDANLKLPKPPT